MMHEQDIDINFTCLVNLPPDIISSVTELCVLGILFRQKKINFQSTNSFGASLANNLLIYQCKLNFACVLICIYVCVLFCI